MNLLTHTSTSILPVVVFTISLLQSSSLFAQNIATTNLTWEADKTTDLRDQNNSNYACVFKTMANQTVEWLQRNGQVSTRFTVTSTEGVWADITSNGSFAYRLSRDGRNGRMMVEKDESGTFITLDFSESGEHSIKQRFRIATVQATP